jgi:tRNA (cytidine/uridine-2'-O-)-methyltransferase
MPLHIVLFEPEIPPNTGNIIRLCANSGAHLHLIEPLGFDLDAKQCRRAGLDYHAMANVHCYKNFQEFLDRKQPQRIFACSSKVNTKYSDTTFNDGDYLLFGPETRGLPAEIIQSLPESQQITIPMQNNNRSLNLSNSVAIILFEAWRQLDFT